MSASVLAVKATARPSDVRAWLAANGFTPGTRGKFSAEEIKAYNRNNSVKYVQAGHVTTKSVTVQDKRGRKVTRKMNPAQVRALLRQHGERVGARGRLTAGQYATAYSLTLSSTDPVADSLPGVSLAE